MALGIAAMALGAGTASANLTPTVSATYESDVPGAHGDYTVDYSFSSAGYTGFPVPAPPTGEATFPGAMDDMKRWILDSPAGMVGNPNAIPYADRCTATQFAKANPLVAAGCPAASRVGTATLTLGADYSGATAAVLTGPIYLLQTEPEVPTTLATSITSGAVDTSATCAGGGAIIPAPTYIKTYSVIAPVTSGADDDFRLRTKSQDDSSRPTLAKNASGTGMCANGHIKAIQYQLDGLAPNGNPFMTMPTRCDSWDSYLYANAHLSNSNVNSDPNETGTNDFVKSPVHSKTPNCTTLPGFNPLTSEVFSTVKRDTAPVVTFNVIDSTIPGGSVPKTIVTTFPKTLSVNGAALPLLCSTAERDAHTCPASSKVGTVEVETALISVPLTGDVFAVQSPNQVPDLTVHVKDPRTGGLDFWIGSTSQLIDSKVITTFDNLPQVGFNKFALRIDAGTTGFLKIRACPDSAARPEDGPIVYDMTSYAGQKSTVSDNTAFAECIGINKLPKPKSCVHHKLNVDPTYASRNNMSKAELFIDGHRVNTNKKNPFEWSWDVGDLDSGKHNLKVRAFYKSGKKAYKKISWTRC